MPYASNNAKVQEIRKKLLEELSTNKIFVQWKDQRAKMVELIIEGDETIHQEYFEHLVGDLLPHDLFSYETFPNKRTETRVLFHVN